MLISDYSCCDKASHTQRWLGWIIADQPNSRSRAHV